MLNGAIEQLNEQLEQKIKKQEHDYLKGYSMYVKSKEKELRQIVIDLNQEGQGNTNKDQIIAAL